MPASVDAYSALAESMRGTQDPVQLSKSIQQLPAVDSVGIAALTHLANERALTLPRRGWELLLLASLAGRAQRFPAIRAGAVELQLSLLASYWGMPRRGAFRARRAQHIYMEEASISMQAAAQIALNLVPWTRPNFRTARDDLEATLTQVQAAGLNEWTAHGLHALAFADMLTGRLDLAQDRLQAARSLFQELGDDLNALRVSYSEGGWYRRAGQADQSMERLIELQREFEQRGAQVDLAKTKYQIGMNELVRGEDLARAQLLLESVEATFLGMEMDLWAAQARSGQAQAAANLGQLTRARALRETAIKAFARHGTIGLQADNLNDQAKLHSLHGDLSVASDLIHGAIDLYEMLGARPSAINARINKGRFLILQSRYQSALGVLEQAVDQLAELDNPSLLAFCQVQLGYAWLGLGFPDQAVREFRAAVVSCEQADRPGLLAEALQAMAHSLQRLGQHQEALSHLQRSLAVARASGDAQVHVSVLRQIAETLQSSGDLDGARDSLTDALAMARELELTLELAASLTTLGDLEALSGREDLALKAWEEALIHNRAVMPEIDMRGHFGRARQAEKSNRPSVAIQAAQEGLAALKRVRRDFWQPRLAGEYSRRWEADAAWAVRYSASSGDASATLNAIEATKAQAFVRQELNRRVSRMDEQTALPALRAEVHWLMDQLRAEPVVPGRRNPRRQQLFTQLSEARKSYNQLMERAERQRPEDELPGDSFPLSFDLDLFRERAGAQYGSCWLALDYFLDQHELTCVWVLPESAGVTQTKVWAADQISLDACRRVTGSGLNPLLDSDLERLGRLLIPDQVKDALDPDTVLLISAYGPLHDVPWAAIHGAPGIPLVARCMPVITPSLETWLLLSQRVGRPLGSPPNGLVMAVSEFKGNFSPLPLAAREAQLLEAHPAIRSQLLINAAATPTQFHAALDQVDTHFDFLHLATHMVADRETGRLSGIAFHHETMFLDDLGGLTDLPPLAVLSGCNGTRALTFGGDERQDFVSAFLLAGANHVLGSIWKVADEQALPVADYFYGQLSQTGRPHVALAAVQRRLNMEDSAWTSWGGYQSVGI